MVTHNSQNCPYRSVENNNISRGRGNSMRGNWDQRVRNPFNRGRGSNSRERSDYRNYPIRFKINS